MTWTYKETFTAEYWWTEYFGLGIFFQIRRVKVRDGLVLLIGLSDTEYVPIAFVNSLAEAQEAADKIRKVIESCGK